MLLVVSESFSYYDKPKCILFKRSMTHKSAVLYFSLVV